MMVEEMLLMELHCFANQMATIHLSNNHHLFKSLEIFNAWAYAKRILNECISRARHGCRTMLRDEAAKEWPFQDERFEY